MDYARLASELLTGLRGPKRSRPGFSRHLGYRSNVAQRWETGATWPTAARFFAICARLKLDVDARISGFLRRKPAWLGSVSLHESAGVAALLGELRGRTRLNEVALLAGYNRYSVSRWFQGTAQLKLPELLALVDACSGRALDFVAAFVDPTTLPCTAAAWRRLALRRELAYTHPASHVLLRALELQPPAGRRAHSEAHLVLRTGLSRGEVEQTLGLLAETGQAKKTRAGWSAGEASVVDTGADPERSRRLKLSWAKLALSRLEAGGAGYAGYSIFAVSRDDLLRLREVHIAYVREMQSIIAASRRTECVGLYCAQMLDLASGDDNVFRQT